MSDKEQHTISFTITGSPTWLSFDEALRKFTGTASVSDISTSTVTVELSDSLGTATQSFSLEVKGNNPP